MHINSAEQTIVSKLCYFGGESADTEQILEYLYQHYSARYGEHTAFERRRFAGRDELEESMSPDEVEAFVERAESTMDADYEELSAGGELVWFRTRLAKSTTPDQFDVYVDAFTVSGDPEDGALGTLAMRGADAVVFVADADDDEATTQRYWEQLQEHWSGPVVLLVVGADVHEPFAEELDFEGPAFAERDGFEQMLGAFQSAAKVALEHARSAN